MVAAQVKRHGAVYRRCWPSSPRDGDMTPPLAASECVADQVDDVSQATRVPRMSPTDLGESFREHLVSHPACRHRQRLTRRRSVTAAPCAAKSFSVRV